MLVLDGNLKPMYSSMKNCHKRLRSQMNIPFKKRKIFNCSSVSNSNGYIRRSGTYSSPENGKNRGVSCLSHRMRKGFILDGFFMFKLILFGH